jgi:hypothetical protein
MKSRSFIITGALVAALALCTPMAAFAQGGKKKADAAASPAASPAAAASASPAAAASTDKPARAIPFHGTATSVDQGAKSFTIEGKTSSRTFMATDQTTVTKGGASATFAELTADEKVSGSYWKKEDGTLELKSLKIGGKEDGGSTKKAKKDAEGEGAATDAAASPAASPKKK